jgi:hypothetical protein
MQPPMVDHARSDNPVLDRLLIAAGQQRITGVDLSLDRIDRLLKRMASPHLKIPPVFHVAGTNGKGSTCAFLRAALEAAGHRVHVFTSPHFLRRSLPMIHLRASTLSLRWLSSASTKSGCRPSMMSMRSSAMKSWLRSFARVYLAKNSSFDAR